MLNSIINQYQNKPNFNHKITTQTRTLPTLPEPLTITYTSLLITYTEYECFTSRYFVTTSDKPGEFLHPIDLQEQIIDNQTGQILGLFYGFNNPAFTGFMDQLIQSGQKFDLILKHSGTVTNIYHGQYKQLKSGKWKKYR